MMFTLTIKLDNDEVAAYGVDNTLPDYLTEVAEHARNGHADAGVVWDGNGANIGRWLITDDEE